jgi:hypothetical protein
MRITGSESRGLPVVGNITFTQGNNETDPGFNLYIFESKSKMELPIEKFNALELHLVSFNYSYFRTKYNPNEKGRTTNLVRGSETQYRDYDPDARKLLKEGSYDMFKDTHDYGACVFLMTKKGSLVRLMMNGGILRGAWKDVKKEHGDIRQVIKILKLKGIEDYTSTYNGNTYKKAVFELVDASDEKMMRDTDEMNELVEGYYDEIRDKHGYGRDRDESQGAAQAPTTAAQSDSNDFNNMAYLEVEISKLADPGKISLFWGDIFQKCEVKDVERQAMALLQKRLDHLNAGMTLTSNGSFEMTKVQEFDI